MRKIRQIVDNKFDLAVVGGGPAGSLIASLAAEEGFSTVVLEQKIMPRSKPCGGFISARALSLLPPDLDPDRGPGESVHTLRVIKRARSFAYCSPGRLGLLVKREHFDHFLLRHAAAKGARILEGFTLRDLKEPVCFSGHTDCYRLEAAEEKTANIFARYVVGADGALGRCGFLGGLRKTGVTPCARGLSELVEAGTGHAVGKDKAGTLEFYPLPGLGGMGWSFHGSGWVNRGVGGLFGPGLLKKAYRELFSGELPGSGPSWWPLPFLGPLKKAGHKNLLLIGDAAGLVEPFSGEGLFNAFKSALLAFYALKKAEQLELEAGGIYNRLYHNHFKSVFLPTLIGAFALHSRAVLNPASLPRHMASLMNNRLSFNQQFKPWT